MHKDNELITYIAKHCIKGSFEPDAPQDYVLSSGEVSSFYVDIKSAILNSVMIGRIREGIFSCVNEAANRYDDPDDDDDLDHGADSPYDNYLFAAPELGAVALLGALVDWKSADGLIIRKAEKGWGLKERIIGKYQEGDKVVYIDDVATSGKTMFENISYLESMGLNVIKAIVVFDREEGANTLVEYTSLVTTTDLRELSKKTKVRTTILK